MQCGNSYRQLPRRGSAVGAAAAMGCRLIGVRDHSDGRHAGGERQGECENDENLFHGNLPSSAKTLPEPAGGLRDSRHVLELFRPVAANPWKAGIAPNGWHRHTRHAG